MQDFYSIYTWAMDRQSQLEREAAERRLLRRVRHAHQGSRWPFPRRREEDHRHQGGDHHQGGLAA